MIQNNQILIITDSLGFPRQAPQTLPYEDTYIHKLKSEFKGLDIIHCGVGGGTIEKLYNQTKYYYEALSPRFVFVQSGIVDCAPRALTATEQQIISRLPIIGAPISEIIKKNSKWIRSKRQITYTPLNEFADYVEKFKILFPSLYWLGIAPGFSEYEYKVPGIIKNITSYNSVIKNIIGEKLLISLDSLTENDLMTDLHHLTTSGHTKVYEYMKNEIYDTGFQSI